MSLEALLPPSTFDVRGRHWWLLFFLLFPLAFAGGILLEFAHERPAEITGGKNRDQLIKVTENFAASKGFAVQGWRHYVISETHGDLRAYYGDLKDPVLQAANRLAPATEVTVLVRSAVQKQEVRTYLSLSGEVLGYSVGKAPGQKQASVDFGVVKINSNVNDTSTGESAAEDSTVIEIARNAFAQDPSLGSLLKLDNATVNTDSDDARRRDVSWDTSPAGRPELVFHVSASVRDSQLVGKRVEAHIEKSYAKHKLHDGDTLPIFLNSVYGFFLAFSAAYAIFRYVKRTLQKEVSHVRTLVVALLFFASYSILIYSIGSDQLAVRVGGDTFVRVAAFSLILISISLFVLGLFTGVGYSSGEGELREAFPGKLTSLDALLAGRLFSRQVAASVLFGAASAGWLLFFYQVLSHFFALDVAALQKDAISYTFARLPWLTLIAGRQYDSLLIAVAGLLLPASFLLRGSGRRKRRFAWFLTFTLLAVLHDAAFPNLAATLLTMLALVSALLVPFFTFDLLAAMVSLSAFALVDEIVRLCSVFPSWKSVAWPMAAVAVMVLIAAWRLALRGRVVQEEDVRPLYAKNLAERMSMQAEILAAREAQLRLLPQSTPSFPGLEFAACCLPARGVGGDFYDFFELDAQRVGIFVAQGGAEGLASALCIALAKGVLMYASRQGLSPLEIILELQDSFEDLLENGGAGGISFAYAVLDTRHNTLSYARVGDSPRLLLYGQGSRLTAFPNWERVSQGVPNAQILEGSAQMKAGDQVVFYTQGVTALRTRRLGRRGTQWLDMLMRELDTRNESLQSSLATMLSHYQRQSAEDLTAVVIRVTAEVPMVQEVVA